MLREKLDIALLEDFVGGMARSTGFRVAVFDSQGELMTTSPPASSYALLSDSSLAMLPRPVELKPIPADEPPAAIGFVEAGGAMHVVAPVHLHERIIGYVAVGEFRNPRATAPPAPQGDATYVDNDQWLRAWESLPPLERGGESRGVVAARWAARMLADWSRREDQLATTADQFSLLGDIGELISGERHLQTILDGIVAETARVMRCQYASLRLLDSATNELRIAAVFNLSNQYSGGTISRKPNAVDEEALRGNIVFVEDAQSDPRIRTPEETKRLGIVSGLAAGMIHRGKPVGTLRIYADHKRRFRASQRQLLKAVASQAAIAIVNARLVEERLRSAEMERQLKLAGDVQTRMVRTRPPPHKHVEAALVFDPSSHVGGDFCDLFTLADGRFAAAVGDVVGHGVPAALLMASIRGALRAIAEQSDNLAEIMRRLNEHVCRETSPAEFVTVLLAAIDEDGRNLKTCTAGHEPLLRLRHGEIVDTKDGSLPLGLDVHEIYREECMELQRGDLLLMVTDGVIEAMNFEGEAFGRERLHGALCLHGEMGATAALRNIHWDIRRFVGLAEQSDDLTLVGLRIV